MSIRTTVRLDEDVHHSIKAVSKTRGIPFRVALNELVRQGLLAESATRRKRPFKIKPLRLGVKPGLSYDCTGALLDLLEGPFHR